MGIVCATLRPPQGQAFASGPIALLAPLAFAVKLVRCGASSACMVSPKRMMARGRYV